MQPGQPTARLVSGSARAKPAPRSAVLGGRSSAHWQPAVGACACACFARPPRVWPRPARGSERRGRRRRRAGCSGKRRRTDFLPLSAFDERALLSDYRFLEEAAAAGDAAQRAAPDRRRAAPPPHLQELAHQVCAPARSARRAARAPGRSCANRRRRLASDVCVGARRGWSSLCCPRTGRSCRRRTSRICPGALCHWSVAASGGPAWRSGGRRAGAGRPLRAAPACGLGLTAPRGTGRRAPAAWACTCSTRAWSAARATAAASTGASAGCAGTWSGASPRPASRPSTSARPAAPPQVLRRAPPLRHPHGVAGPGHAWSPTLGPVP